MAERDKLINKPKKPHTMNLKPLLASLLLTIICTTATAQQQRPWEKFLDELTESDDGDIEVSEEMFDVLSDLEDNPIDINHATRDELSRIPFLTAQQIEDIEAYIYQYHGMKSIGELSLIESLDPIRRQMLQYFITIQNDDGKAKFPKLKDIAKQGRSEVLATMKIPFYTRKGDRDGYLGPKYRHSVRYTFNVGSFIKFGLQGSQDAGEPFFASGNGKGYDYYSYYLVLRRLGRIKTLALGQCKLRLGMGLVMNNDFGFGKMMTLSSLGRSTNSVRAHSSRSQANYMQGAAATVTLTKGLELTGFFSYRGIDATLNEDGTIATIQKSGYHRTKAEMVRKNNAHETATGGNLHWQGGGFHVGVTGVYAHLDRELCPNTKQEYRRYYPAGSNFWNASVDYGYVNSRISFSGETATGNSHGIATINALSFIASNSVSLMLLQRYYGYKYSSLFSQSYSDGGHIQNENGIYFGITWKACENLNIMAYTDYAYFSKPRYQAMEASHSWDNAITATLTLKKWTVLGRYRIRIRQKDNSKKTGLTDDITQRGRLSVGYGGDTWLLRVQGDVAYNGYKDNSYGWMTSLTGGCKVWRLRLVGTFGYFDTDDYASRIYSYERGPLYSFSFPAYYGRGIRYALFVRGDITKDLMLICKCGISDYFDRDHISSGLQQIDGSSQTDLELQLRWKF